MDATNHSIADTTSGGPPAPSDQPPSPIREDATHSNTPIDQDALISDRSSHLPRPLYVASDILQPEPPPNLDVASPPMSKFRLVPVTDELESNASSPSSMSERPTPQALPERDELSTEEPTDSFQSNSLHVAITPFIQDAPQETPIPPPPDTPLHHIPETPHPPPTNSMRNSVPPDALNQGQFDERTVKSESPGLDALHLPQNMASTSRHRSNPPPSIASTSTSHSRNRSAPGPIGSVTTRRTTRGSLAAAAEAAKQPKSDAITPGPGGGIQVSHNTCIITQEKNWVLPEAQFGVSLAQIIPRDCEVKPWMRYTRHPIVWDGRTDAGGKTGKKLMVAPSALAADPHLQDAAALYGGRLDGLHMLMDYKEGERPIYSYALMTRFAILGSPYKSLSLAEIYVMLEAKFPWFQKEEGKWRDSIRYNLSSNRWFVKTKRQLHQPGVGNLWKVDENSLGGPKRPRKRQRNGTAFADAEDDDDGEDFDEDAEPSPDESSSWNGTLMLTFDSKQPVPVDKRQADRAASGQAQHHQLSRVTPRVSTEQQTETSWSTHHSNEAVAYSNPSENRDSGQEVPMAAATSTPNNSAIRATSQASPPAGQHHAEPMDSDDGDIGADDSGQGGIYSPPYDETNGQEDIEMLDNTNEAENTQNIRNPVHNPNVARTLPPTPSESSRVPPPYHPSLVRQQQPHPPRGTRVGPRYDDAGTPVPAPNFATFWNSKGEKAPNATSVVPTSPNLSTSNVSTLRTAATSSSTSKPLAPAPTSSSMFPKQPASSRFTSANASSSNPAIASVPSNPRSSSPTLPAHVSRPSNPSGQSHLRSLAQLPSRDTTRTPPRPPSSSRLGSTPPPFDSPSSRYQGLPTRSPYTIPPLPSESRKRKLFLTSPASSRITLDSRAQKLRRVEDDADRLRRMDRSERTNPIFGLSGRLASGGSGSTSVYGGTTAASTSLMPPPPPPPNVNRTQGTAHPFTTPLLGSRFSSNPTTAAGPSTGVAFGQRGFLFKGPSGQPSHPLNDSRTPPASTGQGFGSFGSSQPASFFSPGRSQSGTRGDRMDVDSEGDDLSRDRRRTTSMGSRMDTDRSDDEEDESRGSRLLRNQPVSPADNHSLAGRMTPAGMFAQAATGRFGSSLSVSVPVSSSRMERGPSTPRDIDPTSSTSVPRPTSTTLSSSGVTHSSSRLPSIDSLLHQSSPTNYSSSLPPIPDMTGMSNSPLPLPPHIAIPTQQTLPTPPRTASPALPRPASPAPSSPVLAGTPQRTLGRPIYFGFIIMHHTSVRSLLPPRKEYNGGDDIDTVRRVKESKDWRD